MQTFGHLQSHIALIEEYKEDILDLWMHHHDVQHTLERHDISTDFFVTHFGIRVINYAIGVVKGSNALGNCPVIGVMLVFFNKRNIPLEDIFLICVNLKNSLINMMLHHELLTKQLLDEIAFLVDRNFHGVISEYIKMHYHHELEHASCTLNTHPLVLQEPAHKPKTTAVEYIQETDMDWDSIVELSEIAAESLEVIDLTLPLHPESYHMTLALLQDYWRVLHHLIEFKELCEAIKMLLEILQTTPFEVIEVDKRDILSIYIKAIFNDLHAWKQSVFIEQNAHDIHYLDQTILSSIKQLQITLCEQTHLIESDVEFF